MSVWLDRLCLNADDRVYVEGIVESYKNPDNLVEAVQSLFFALQNALHYVLTCETYWESAQRRAVENMLLLAKERDLVLLDGREGERLENRYQAVRNIAYQVAGLYMQYALNLQNGIIVQYESLPDVNDLLSRQGLIDYLNGELPRTRNTSPNASDLGLLPSL